MPRHDFSPNDPNKPLIRTIDEAADRGERGGEDRLPQDEASLLERAGPGDVRAVHALVCGLEEADFAFEDFRRIYEANLADARIEYYLIVSGGKTCGFLSLHYNRLLHHNGLVAEIQELVVSESERGQGLGERVLAEALEIAKRKNALRIEACTNLKRLRAHGFYEKCGFERTHYKFTRDLTGGAEGGEE